MANIYKYGTYGQLGESVAQSGVQAGTVAVYVGTAPVNLIRGYDDLNIVNKPVKLSNLRDAQNKVGYTDDWGSFTLCEAISAHFNNPLGNIGPIYVINVLDPDVHRKASSTSKSLTFTGGRAEFVSDTIILDTLTLPNLEEDTDYSVDYSFVKNAVIITSLNTSNPITGTVVATYYEVDDTLVDVDDIIGGVTSGGVYTGLGALQLLYPTEFAVANLIAAPGWSHIPRVYNALVTAADKINGHWDAFVLADIPIVHTEEKADDIAEAVDMETNIATLTEADLDTDTLVVKPTSTGTAATITTDYTFTYEDDVLTVTATSGGTLNNRTSIYITCEHEDPVPEAVDTIALAQAWKTAHGYTNERSKVCWPMVENNTAQQFHLSTMATVELMRADFTHNSVPMETCGNKAIPAIKQYFGNSTNAGFDQSTANELTQKGITTAVAWAGRFVLWGNHTAAYTYGADVDPRAIFDVNVRMLYYKLNDFQREWAHDIDKPMTRAMKDRIIVREQEKLDNDVRRGAFIGSPKIVFSETENPTTDLMNGDFRFDGLMTPTPPGKSFTMVIAYTDAGFTDYFTA